MEDLEKMADSNKKGTKRMGVKRWTYFPWIPVENYILPVLHLKIGLGNNVIDAEHVSKGLCLYTEFFLVGGSHCDNSCN